MDHLIYVSKGHIPNLGPVGPLLHVKVCGGGCVKQFYCSLLVPSPEWSRCRYVKSQQISIRYVDIWGYMWIVGKDKLWTKQRIYVFKESVHTQLYLCTFYDDLWLKWINLKLGIFLTYNSDITNMPHLTRYLLQKSPQF